jgi:hypothetical protein
MKNKIKYSLGIITTFMIGLYSYDHPEKYHILISVMFGALTVLGIALLVTDKK